MLQKTKTISLTKQHVSWIRDCLPIRKSLVKFTTELGYDNAPFHTNWYNFLQPKNDPNHFSPLREHPLAQKRFHLEAPRKHGKSECIAINYPSWLIGNYPNIHITIVSKTATLAEASLGAIVSRIENNEGYKEVFGDLKPKNPQKWTNEQIYVERTETSKFPTIHATGLYGPLTGGGNDIIIADDVIDESNVRTRLQVEKASTWFHKVLLTTLFPWGAVLAIGTRWHHNDLYSELLEKWDSEILRAILNPTEYAKGEPAEVLWPEYWPIERLEDKRNEIGSVFFDCQYQNDPTGMEGELLKAEWLHTWETVPPTDAIKYAGVDPALGEGDKHGIATLSRDRQTRQGYLEELWCEKVPLPSFLRELQRLHNVHHYAKIFLEANAFQKVLMFLPELRGLPIVPTQTVRDKEQRFIAMSSHFESKRVLVNPLIKTPRNEFYIEWIQFPRGQYDDALDCAEIVTRNVVGRSGEAFIIPLDFG